MYIDLKFLRMQIGHFYSFATIFSSKEVSFFLFRKVSLVRRKIIRLYCIIENASCFVKRFLAKASIQKWDFSPSGYISQGLKVLDVF